MPGVGSGGKPAWSGDASLNGNRPAFGPGRGPRRAAGRIPRTARRVSESDQPQVETQGKTRENFSAGENFAARLSKRRAGREIFIKRNIGSVRRAAPETDAFFCAKPLKIKVPPVCVRKSYVLRCNHLVRLRSKKTPRNGADSTPPLRPNADSLHW